MLVIPKLLFNIFFFSINYKLCWFAFQVTIRNWYHYQNRCLEEKPLNRTLSRDLDLHLNICLRTGPKTAKADNLIVKPLFTFKSWSQKQTQNLHLHYKMGFKTGQKNA